MSKPIVFIGASGAVCQRVIQRIIKAYDAPFVLADINLEPVEALRASMPNRRATTLKLDLFDHKAMVSAIKGAALVVLGAGPYTRTGLPTMEACLEAKAALDMQERAKQAGVAFYIGCGASPGLNNILDVDAASELDTVTSIDVCWLVGNEKSGAGLAVMEHTLHIASGPCLTWAGGKPVLSESCRETRYAPMLGKKEIVLHETAHPEPVTLPRMFPKADSIKCFGGLYPASKFGSARGLGNAVRHGFLPISEAAKFQLKARHGEMEPEVAGQLLQELTTEFPRLKIECEPGKRLLNQAKGPHKIGSHALEDMIDQIRRGESSVDEVRDFIIEAAGCAEKVETAGALLARVVGFRNGCPTVVVKRTPTDKKFEDLFLLKSMSSVTGTSCAAFIYMALNLDQRKGGVFCPEDWAEPKTFYGALEKVGVPKDELPQTYTY